MSGMGRFNRSGRIQRVYVEDHPEAPVWDIDCVPETRPKGSWTNGTKAWSKPTSTEGAKWIGWFTPPRMRRQRKANSHWLRPERTFSFEEE